MHGERGIVYSPRAFPGAEGPLQKQPRNLEEERKIRLVPAKGPAIELSAGFGVDVEVSWKTSNSASDFLTAVKTVVTDHENTPVATIPGEGALPTLASVQLDQTTEFIGVHAADGILHWNKNSSPREEKKSLVIVTLNGKETPDVAALYENTTGTKMPKAKAKEITTIHAAYRERPVTYSQIHSTITRDMAKFQFGDRSVTQKEEEDFRISRKAEYHLLLAYLLEKGLIQEDSDLWKTGGEEGHIAMSLAEWHTTLGNVLEAALERTTKRRSTAETNNEY